MKDPAPLQGATTQFASAKASLANWRPLAGTAVQGQNVHRRAADNKQPVRAFAAPYPVTGSAVVHSAP